MFNNTDRGEEKMAETQFIDRVYCYCTALHFSLLLNDITPGRYYTQNYSHLNSWQFVYPQNCPKTQTRWHC